MYVEAWKGSKPLAEPEEPVTCPRCSRHWLPQKQPETKWECRHDRIMNLDLMVGGGLLGKRQLAE